MATPAGLWTRNRSMPTSTRGVRRSDAEQLNASPVGDRVLGGQGCSDEFGQEVVGQRQVGALRGHPTDPVFDRVRVTK